MFQVFGDMDMFDIGVCNVEVVWVVLVEIGVFIVVQDVGGMVGCTMRYFVGLGRVYVWELGMVEKELQFIGGVWQVLIVFVVDDVAFMCMRVGKLFV